MRAPPSEGQRYKHFKGNVYTIICVAHEADLGIDFVVHRGPDGRIWTRSLTNFLGTKNLDQAGEVIRFELEV